MKMKKYKVVPYYYVGTSTTSIAYKIKKRCLLIFWVAIEERIRTLDYAVNLCNELNEKL